MSDTRIESARYEELVQLLVKESTDTVGRRLKGRASTVEPESDSREFSVYQRIMTLAEHGKFSLNKLAMASQLLPLLEDFPAFRASALGKLGVACAKLATGYSLACHAVGEAAALSLRIGERDECERYAQIIQLLADDDEWRRFATTLLASPIVPPRNKPESLADYDLLRGLPATTHAALGKAVRPARFAQGEYICHEGQPGHEMLLITCGRVAILNRQGDSDRLVAIRGASSVVGEMAFLARDNLRTATCVAIAETSGLSVSFQALTQIGGLRNSRTAYTSAHPQFSPETRRVTAPLTSPYRRSRHGGAGCASGNG